MHVYHSLNQPLIDCLICFGVNNQLLRMQQQHQKSSDKMSVIYKSNAFNCSFTCSCLRNETGQFINDIYLLIH